MSSNSVPCLDDHPTKVIFGDIKRKEAPIGLKAFGEPVPGRIAQ